MPKKLTEQDRIKLDGIVQQMVSNGETDDDIKFVVEDFKGKYGVDEVLDTPSPEVKKKEVTIPTTPLQPKTEYPLASGLSSGSIHQSPTQSIPTVQSSGQSQRNPNWYDKYIPEEYRTPEVLAKVKNIARTSSPSEALNKINQLKGDIDISTGKIKTKNVDKVISDNEKLIVNKNYDFNEQVNQNYDQLSTQVKEGNIQNGYNGITAEQNTEIKKLSYEGALQSEAGQRRQSVFDAETQIEQQVSNDIDRFGKFIQKTTIAPNVKEWLLENKNTAKDLVVSPTSHPTFLKEYTKIYKTDIERQREIELDKLSKSTPFSEQYSELDQSIRPEYQAKINEINNKYNEFISKYQTKLSPLAKLKASTIVLQEGLANKKMPDVSKIGSMVLESLGVPEYEKAERLKSEGVGLTPDQKIATEKVGNEALKDFVSVYKPSADEGNPASKKLVAVANHLIKTNDEILKDNPEFVNKQVSEAISNEIANNPKEYYGVTINGIPTAGVQQTFGLYDINDEMIAKAGKKLGIPQEYYSRITDKDIKSGNILGSFTSGAIGETALGIGGLSERLSNLSKGYSLETSNELANRWEDKAGFWKGLYNPASASNIQEDATIVDLDKTSDTYLQNIKNPNAGSWNLNLSTVLDKMFYGGGMILGLGKGGSSMGKLMQSARLLNTEAGLINKSEKALELGYKAESAIDRAKYGTEATELLAKSGKASELADQLGMFTYGYMSGFDRNYRTGLTQFEGQPNADKKALVYAGMYSFIENAVEQMGFSEVKFVRGLSKTGTQRMTDLVERITSEGINSFDKKTLKENLTSVIKSGIKVGGDITAEVAEEISTNIGDIMIKMLTGANKDPNADFLKDQWNTAVHTVIQMALTTGLGEIRQKSPMRENVQYQVALQPEAVRQAIKEQEIAGKINTATAIERMKTVNTLVELNNEIPQQDPISGKVLSTKEKIQYLNEGLKERLANHALEKTTDEVQKKRYEQIIKEAQEVKIKILETPTLEEETPQGIGVVEVDGKFTVNNPNGTKETFDTRELADARVVELSNPINTTENATQNPQTTSTESTTTIGQNELPQTETTVTEDVTTTEIEQPKPISAKLDGKDVTIEKTESGYTYTRPNGFEIEVTEDEHLQNIKDKSVIVNAEVGSKEATPTTSESGSPTTETAPILLSEKSGEIVTVNVGGKAITGTVEVDEGGKVTISSGNKIFELENDHPFVDYASPVRVADNGEGITVNGETFVEQRFEIDAQGNERVVLIKEDGSITTNSNPQIIEEIKYQTALQIMDEMSDEEAEQILKKHESKRPTKEIAKEGVSKTDTRTSEKSEQEIRLQEAIEEIDLIENIALEELQNTETKAKLVEHENGKTYLVKKNDNGTFTATYNGRNVRKGNFLNNLISQYEAQTKAESNALIPKLQEQVNNLKQEVEAKLFGQPQSIEFQTPELNLARHPNPFDKFLEKLGYSEEDIAGMTIEQKQQIAESKTEKPVVESSSKVDVVKENAKQEKIAEAQKKIDDEVLATNTPTEKPKADALKDVEEDIVITKDNYKEYLDYLRDGGKLSPMDLIDLRVELGKVHRKEQDDLYEKVNKEGGKIDDAYVYSKNLNSEGRKLGAKQNEEMNLVVNQPNSYGLAGDINAPIAYHFTDPMSILNILDDNSLYGDGEVSGVSTTTNRALGHPESTNVQQYGEGNKPLTFADKGIRIDLDLQKLKNDGIKIRIGNENLGTFEGEEELKIGGYDGIKDLNKYIKQIEVDKKILDEEPVTSAYHVSFEDIKKAAEKHGIKVVEKTDYERPRNKRTKPIPQALATTDTPTAETATNETDTPTVSSEGVSGSALKDVESTAKALEIESKNKPTIWEQVKQFIKDTAKKVGNKLGIISNEQHLSNFEKAKADWDKLSSREKKLKRADYELDDLHHTEGGYYKVGDSLIDLDLNASHLKLLLENNKFLNILNKLGVNKIHGENRPPEEMFAHYSDNKIHLNNNSAFENIRQVTNAMSHELGHHEWTKLTKEERNYVRSLPLETGMAKHYEAQEKNGGKQTSASLQEENFADYVMQYFQGKLYGDEALLNKIPTKLREMFDNKYSDLLKDNEHSEVAEAYHKAKADGTNPELVKAVEELLGKPTEKQKTETTPTVSSEGVSGSALKDVEEDSEKWYKAKKTIKDKDGNDIKLTIDKNKDDKHFYIKATDSNGKEVGSALFETSDGEVWSGNEIEVNEANRRKGIMSAMYDFAESEGHPLEPTKTLSKEGKAFWDNRKAPTQYTEAATPAKKESAGVSGSALKDVVRQESDAEKLNKEAGVDIYVARQDIDTNGGKYTLSQIKENGNTNTFLIEDAKGNEVGKAQLSANGNYLENIRIDEKHRRKGLASKVYDFIELRKGIELEPSPNKQSKEAKALWDKRNLQKSVSNKANGGLLAKALGESMSKTFADFRNKQQVLLELENKYFEQKGLSKEEFNKLSENEKSEIIKDAIKWKNDNPELVKAVESALATNTVEGKAETPKSQTKNTENEKQQPNEGNIDQDGNIRSEPKNQGELAKIENEIARIEENIAEREREEGITTGKVAVADIIVQPKTFQFKATDETESGVNKTEKLQGTYDRNVGGTISVWKDTKNELGNGANKIYVVDGHHRLDLAKRSGTKDLDVFFIEAETAKDARLAGARANIAQGRGTSIDSAKIFRESPDKMGSLKPNSKVGKEGEALSKLNDNVFELVATGKLPIKVGIALSQVDQKYQTEIAPIVNKFANNPIATQDKLNRYARKVQEAIQSGNAEVKEIQTLFGAETQVDIQNSAIVESEIINAIKNDARLFSSVKNNKEVLENANNQIDVETATEESEKAKKSAGLFDTFRTRKSVSDIYNKAVADYKNAKTSKQKSDIISKASTQVKDAIQKELDSTFGTPQKSTSKPKKSISKEAFTALTNMLKKAFPKVKFIDEARAKEILEKFGFDNISKMFIGNKNANLFSESFNGKTIGENFNFANELEAQGKSSDEIKFATGWFKAGDGKWRYEITDNEAKLKDKLPNKGEEVTTKLKYILDHPKLLELYPQLENTEITITNDNTNSSHGLHYKLGNKHYIVVNTTGDINQTISEILHEVQHAVQLESGLSVGANNNTIYQRKLEVFKDKFGRSPSADESRTLAIEANREYQSTYGEIEAKATQDNAKQSEQQRVFDSTIEKTINKYGINKDDITYRSLNDIQYLETPDGTVFGFQKGDEIFLDPELMNADTPIHEVVGHYVINIIDAQSRGGDAKATAVMLKGFALLKEPEGKAVLDEVQANPAYANLPLRKQKLEALATIIGREGASVFDEGTKGAKQGNTFQQKVKAFINSFYEYIKSKLPTLKDKSIEDIGKMDNKEFIRAIIGDAFRGEIVENNLSLQNKTKTNEQTIKLTRLSEQSEQGRQESGRINAEATIITSSVHRDVQEKQGVSNPNAYGKIKQLEEKALIDYATKNDLLIELPNAEIIGDGNESDVYPNSDPNKITKVTFPNNYNSWLELLDSIAIHNAENPNAKYEIKGFTKNKDGEFSIFVEQNQIQGTPAPFDKIHEDLINKGYELSGEYGDGRYINKEKGIVIEDVKEDNVLIGSNGELFYIDTDYYPFDKLRGGTVKVEYAKKPTEEINFSSEPNPNSPISDKNKKVIEGLVQDIKEGKKTEQEVRDLINDNPKSWVDKFTPYLDLQLSQLNDTEYQKSLAKYEEVKAIKSEKVRKNELLKIINDNFDTITETLIKNNKIKRIC